MTFDDVVGTLGKRLGVEIVAKDGNAVVSIDEMEIVMQEVEAIGGFCLLGEIGEAPPSEEKEVMAASLAANHLFQGTGGATISRDSVSGKFFLCRYERLDYLDAEKAFEMLERFVDTLDIWHRTFENFRSEEAENADSEDFDTQMNWIYLRKVS